MEDSRVECLAEYHELRPLGGGYHKFRKDLNWSDWFLGTQYDRSLAYTMLVCINCGMSWEAPCEDRNPDITVMETVVHEMSIPTETKESEE